MAQSRGYRIRLLVGAAGVVLLLLAARGVSEPGLAAISVQNGETLHACFTPAGTMYLIKQPGLKQECAGNHVEVSFNAQGPPGISGVHRVLGPVSDPVNPGASVAAFAVCPTGEVALNGGNGATEIKPGAVPVLKTSRASSPLDAWEVNMINLGTDTFRAQAVVVCAMVAS